MHEPHSLDDAADRFFTEVDHLERSLDREPMNVELTLSIAKRCRRSINDVVRTLARVRDGEG